MARYFGVSAIVVVAAVGLYALLGWLVMLRRKPCPYCGVKAVQVVSFVRATVLVDGKRAPDSWSYCECDICHARFKDHCGAITIPSDEEWKRNYYKN
jgi:hypothetical protein